MAGNVSEWVLDVYRPLNSYEVSDLRPFRGNVFKTPVRDAEGFLAEKDSLGHMKYRDITTAEAANRKNYRQADNINYLDGDYASSINNESWLAGAKDSTGSTNLMYQYGISSLITDHARVYKGGSWRDEAFYLSPGTRRYLDENGASDAIGFRCAMTRVGGSIAGR
jgi:formylglycine-generating enzyme required for sulfatase activity